MKKRIPSYWIITIVLIVLNLAIHFATATIYELHRDEMLYFVEGQHLSIGYISTPPLVGLLSFIVRIIFGYSEFGLKLFPALAGGASLLVIALFVKEFSGKNLALIIAGTAYLVSGAFLRGNALFMPVCFDEFFWLLSAYLFFKMVNRENPKLWIWIGVVFGVAFLNKYAIAFFAFALFTALLISRHRRLFLSKYLLIGLFAGFIIALPNLLWQHFHNWPVIGHMKELQRTQLINVTVSNFLIQQLVMCMSAIGIWIPGLVMLFLRQERKYRFLGWAFLFAIIILLLGRGKPYYTLGAYPMMFAAGGYLMEKYFTGRWVYMIYFILFSAMLGSVLTSPLALPYASYKTLERICDPETGFVPQIWEDGKEHPIPQDYADMTGWKELAAIVAKAYNQLDSKGKSQCTIYADNYGQASAIQFYGHQYGLPQPVCFNDSYLLWAPDTISDAPFIYVSHQVGDIDDLFNNYKEIGRVNNSYFREDGLMVLLCTDPKPFWKEFYRQKVRIRKNNYRFKNSCDDAVGIDTSAVIEAEDCCSSYGIDTEMTTDSSGGSNIGWINGDDWMEYKIDIPEAKDYGLSVRVASPNNNGTLAITCNGLLLTTIKIPATGGWQKWNTLHTNVSLPKGKQTIRIKAISGGWNINWWKISLPSL